MNLTTKKIIAREFILFILCVAISLVIFLCTYIFAYLNDNKIKYIKEQITIEKKIVDSLNRMHLQLFDEFGIPIRRKNNNPFAEFGGHEIIDKNQEDKDLLPPPPQKKLSTETSNIYDFLISNGLTSKSQTSFYHEYRDISKQKILYDFMLLNGQTKDNFKEFSKKNFPQSEDLGNSNRELDFKKIETKKVVINKLQSNLLNYSAKKIPFSRQINISVITFLACLLFAFVFRYIYYSITWSFRVLNEK